MADYDQERGLVEAAELARGLRADREYLERDTGELRSREGFSEQLNVAIRNAAGSGQWSAALDLIRTGLIEPLERERDQALTENERLREALRLLTERVEHQWPRLRVPEKVKKVSPQIVGTQLRRAAEEARQALDTEAE